MGIDICDLSFLLFWSLQWTLYYLNVFYGYSFNSNTFFLYGAIKVLVVTWKISKDAITVLLVVAWIIIALYVYYMGSLFHILFKSTGSS